MSRDASRSRDSSRGPRSGGGADGDRIDGGDDVIAAISDFFSRYSQRGGASRDRDRERERGSPSPGANRSLSASEMARLESMWKQAKRELVEQSREIATLQARVVRERNAKASAAQAKQDEAAAQLSASKQVDELRDRARFMELQFSEVKGENERLRLSYNEALMKLGESLRVLEEKASIHAQMSAFISSLELRVAALTEQGESLTADRNAVVAHSLEAMQEHDAEMQKKQAEIKALQQQADAREAMLQHLQADRETHTLHIASLEVHVAQLQRRETVLTAEMSALREQLAALHAEKALFLEQRAATGHLTEDNARLVTLLLSTPQYKSWCVTNFPLRGGGTGRQRRGTSPSQGGASAGALVPRATGRSTSRGRPGSASARGTSNGLTRGQGSGDVAAAASGAAGSEDTPRYLRSSYLGPPEAAGGPSFSRGGSSGNAATAAQQAAAASARAATVGLGYLGGPVESFPATVHHTARGRGQQSDEGGSGGSGGASAPNWGELEGLRRKYGVPDVPFEDARSGGGGGGGGGAHKASAGPGSPGRRACGCGVGPVHDVQQHGGTAGKGGAAGGSTSTSAAAADAEAALWVPSEVVALAARFRGQWLRDVPVEAVRTFLVDLNSVWLRRMRLAAARVRRRWHTEVVELRRRVMMTEPYREVMQASTIARLQVELQALRESVGLAGGLPGPATAVLTGDLGPLHLAQHPDRLGPAWVPGGGSASLVRGGGRSAAPALSAQLLSVPGSGAQRLDADESSRLLERALQAVDVLTRQLSDTAAENEELTAELAAAQKRLALPPPTRSADDWGPHAMLTQRSSSSARGGGGRSSTPQQQRSGVPALLGSLPSARGSARGGGGAAASGALSARHAHLRQSAAASAAGAAAGIAPRPGDEDDDEDDGYDSCGLDGYDDGREPLLPSSAKDGGGEFGPAAQARRRAAHADAQLDELDLKLISAASREDALEGDLRADGADKRLAGRRAAHLRAVDAAGGAVSPLVAALHARVAALASAAVVGLARATEHADVLADAAGVNSDRPGPPPTPQQAAAAAYALGAELRAASDAVLHVDGEVSAAAAKIAVALDMARAYAKTDAAFRAFLVTHGLGSLRPFPEDEAAVAAEAATAAAVAAAAHRIRSQSAAADAAASARGAAGGAGGGAGGAVSAGSAGGWGLSARASAASAAAPAPSSAAPPPSLLLPNRGATGGAMGGSARASAAAAPSAPASSSGGRSSSSLPPAAGPDRLTKLYSGLYSAPPITAGSTTTAASGSSVGSSGAVAVHTSSVGLGATGGLLRLQKTQFLQAAQAQGGAERQQQQETRPSTVDTTVASASAVAAPTNGSSSLTGSRPASRGSTGGSSGRGAASGQGQLPSDDEAAMAVQALNMSSGSHG